MCNFWSCILTRDNRVIWDKDSNSHEEQIKKAGLADSKLEGRDFVRIEVVPRTRESIFSKKASDWKLVVDEEKTLPAWFTSTRPNLEARVWGEWRAAMKATLWKLDLSAVKRVVREVKHIKYFSMRASAKKSWHVSLGVNWVAAWAAAGAAARDAAWDATWAAAGDAAWDAAWAAARDANLLTRVLLTRLKGKHLKHAQARMDVWRRGWGVRCDVNGKLYVYGVKKK